MTLHEVLVSPQHKAIIVPNDGRVANLFPHGKRLPDGRTVLPHKPDEVRVLRNLGFQVPSPIFHNYTWPAPAFHAQKVTAAMLTIEPRAYVLNTMGTGKTRSVLFAFDWLRQEGLVRKLLVVAPLSTLNFTWAREVFQIFPKYRTIVLHGTKKRRQKLLQEDADIYIINHDGLSVLHEDIAAKFGTDDAVCIDEVSVYRKSTTKKHKVARRIVSCFGRVWGMTGTPTPREPTDAYGIMLLINPKGEVRAFRHFRDELMTKVGPFRWVPRPNAHHKVFGYMQPSVRFTLEECMDMPPVVNIDVEAALTSEQSRVYKEMVTHCKGMLERHEIKAANEGVVINKLLQITTGSVFVKRDVSVDIPCGPRLDALKELVDANERSVIVFTPFVPTIGRIVAHLMSEYTVHAIHGGVSQNERTQAFNQFTNDPRKQVIVAHPATMAHGLTLTAANLIVWYGPTHDLEIYEQANARIIRPGQTANRVVLAHIVASPIERKVYRRLKNKEKMQGSLLELFE